MLGWDGRERRFAVGNEAQLPGCGQRAAEPVESALEAGEPGGGEGRNWEDWV